jgi:diaminopimelate decarboxylase
MVMNGSNKDAAEIEAAIRHGVRINIDSAAEIAAIEALASTPVQVNLRLKPLPPDIDRFSAAFFKSAGSMLDAVRRTKWGFSREAAAPLIQQIQQFPNLTLCGYSCHIGRFSSDPEAFGVVAAELARDVVRLFEQTGFWPAMLDIGGGWPRQREPESRAAGMNPHAIEAYAKTACDALREHLAPAGQPTPALWLEPGRYLVGNAMLLLTRVGATKRDLGHVWMHVDASTNNLMRTETSGAWHQILPATRMDEALAETVDVVGGTCIPSILGAQRPMPPLAPGEAVAILDTGMYAEVLANQFNSLGRPATVLVSDASVHLVRRRETVTDVFAQHLLPEYLQTPMEHPA